MSLEPLKAFEKEVFGDPNTDPHKVFGRLGTVITTIAFSETSPISTLPKTNSLHLKIGLLTPEKEMNHFPTIHLQVLCLFQGGYHLFQIFFKSAKNMYHEIRCLIHSWNS